MKIKLDKVIITLDRFMDITRVVYNGFELNKIGYSSRVIYRLDYNTVIKIDVRRIDGNLQNKVEYDTYNAATPEQREYLAKVWGYKFIQFKDDHKDTWHVSILYQERIYRDYLTRWEDTLVRSVYHDLLISDGIQAGRRVTNCQAVLYDYGWPDDGS